MFERRVVRSATVTAALAVLLAVALVGSLAFGAEVLPVAKVVDAVLHDRPGPVSTIVRDLRMPRSLLAAIVGAGLALAGHLVS